MQSDPKVVGEIAGRLLDFDFPVCTPPGNRIAAAALPISVDAWVYDLS